ncbi:MAG: LPD7 domain-containing protein, partial [Brevundimonas aurantiaca]
MLRIAQHRGWSGIKVSGDDAFRREVWVQGRSLGLAVAGYKPTERDRQAAKESTDRAGRRATEPSREEVKRRLDMAAVVVRTLISDPATQARLLQQAWARVHPGSDKSRGP